VVFIEYEHVGGAQCAGTFRRCCRLTIFTPPRQSPCRDGAERSDHAIEIAYCKRLLATVRAKSGDFS
jgi:hypothetical protein